MKKFFLIFFCCFLAMTTLTGCMAEKSSTGRVLTDGAGREVRIPEKPSRIVSLTYGTDEILLGLVSTRRISALSKYAGDEGRGRGQKVGPIDRGVRRSIYVFA